MTPGAALVEVTRRDVRSGREHVESVHTGHLVVTGADGEVLAAIGEPETSLFVRSTVKPLQAATCLELLGAAAQDLSDAEVAIACSSHRGEPQQIEVVRRLLERSGTRPGDLTCPPAAPAADRGATPARILHNCSGKHALFALAGAALGMPRTDLLDPEGALQRVMLADLQDALGAALAVGVDGCGAPAVATPLVGVARAFAGVASDERYARIRRALFAFPELVGGENRLETALLDVGVVAKPGAEGAFGAGWLAPDGSARGLVARAADGSSRGATAAVIAVLVDLEVVGPAIWQPRPPLGGGEPAGRVRAAPAVRDMVERLRARV